MSQKICNSFDTGIMKFQFTDEDGDIVSFFRLNPTDIAMVKRAEGMQKFFNELKQPTGDFSVEQFEKLNDRIEDEVCRLLGYDAKKDVFGWLSATTVLPDGNMFGLLILETISDAVKPELEKRSRSMRESVEKYTKKYEQV